jgi:brefeldin A-inhibited guanine nucleotide-exchange protein
VNVLSKTTISRSLAHDSNSNITLQNAPAAAVITAAMPLTSTSVTQGHLTSSTTNTATAEISIRYKALESLVSILRSLVNWSDKNEERLPGTTTDSNNTTGTNDLLDESCSMSGVGGEHRSSRNSLDTVHTGPGDTDSIVDTPPPTAGATTHSGSDISSVITTDDPEHFSHRKQRKQLLEEGIRLFGWKPKKVYPILHRY